MTYCKKNGTVGPPYNENTLQNVADQLCRIKQIGN